jgi:Uma2 family endonuclease
MARMNAPLRRPMSFGEFLDWEDCQPLRHEFDGVAPVAMTGGTRAHAQIQRNLAFAMHSRLRGKPCQFFGNDLKIEVAGSVRYPDGFVTCTPGAPADKVARDPVVIFEVLSQSTAATDTVVKNREYAATPSVRRYVMLAQDVAAGTMFERVGEDWIGHVLGPESILAMPEIGVEVPIAEFYEGVELAAASTEDEVSGST